MHRLERRQVARSEEDQLDGTLEDVRAEDPPRQQCDATTIDSPEGTWRKAWESEAQDYRLRKRTAHPRNVVRRYNEHQRERGQANNDANRRTRGLALSRGRRASARNSAPLGRKNDQLRDAGFSLLAGSGSPTGCDDNQIAEFRNSTCCMTHGCAGGHRPRKMRLVVGIMALVAIIVGSVVTLLGLHNGTRSILHMERSGRSRPSLLGQELVSGDVEMEITACIGEWRLIATRRNVEAINAPMSGRLDLPCSPRIHPACPSWKGG